MTVDTEGDNLWGWKPGQEITTENSKYIPRFQNLCEKYGVKPVYLTNYEMATDSRFVSYIKPKAANGKCEIGMHCHAWNSPPDFPLNGPYPGNPYITEYPEDIMFKKMEYMTSLLESIFEEKMLSHRAGRWASSKAMFNCLKELGYKVDCSWVSGMDLSHLPGAAVPVGFNYKDIKNKVYMPVGGVLEVPMTAMHLHHVEGVRFRSKVKHALLGQDIWLRPAVSSEQLMKKVMEKTTRSGSDYIEFMIHSSELMPGGSPYCRNNEQIEVFYRRIESVFQYLSEKYERRTLSEFTATINSHRSE